MSSNYPELTFSDDEDFDSDRLNKAMGVLDQRLRSLEPFTPSWEAAVNDLRLVGLSRLNDAILPAYQKVQLLSTMGFLFAGSNTSRTLVQNQSATFVIHDLTERDLFTPTPFLALTRSSTTADYAIGQLVSYERSTGTLMILVKAITGNAGPHTDWQIGAAAANTMAAMAYFVQIDAARAAALAAQVTASANAVSTAADKVQTTADAASALQSKNAAAASAIAAALWDPVSYYTKTQVDVKFTDLVNVAPAALDTLKELATALGNDAAFSTTVATSLGNRLRVDTAAQGLTGTQQTNARTNLALGAASLKNLSTSAQILANTGTDVLTNDQAWAATGWVNLGNKTGAVAIDMATGSRFTMTAIGNVTISVVNQKSGQPLDIAVIQDATGNRTVSWSAMFYWPDANVPIVKLTANAIGILYSGVYHPNGWFMGAGWKINA